MFCMGVEGGILRARITESCFSVGFWRRLSDARVLTLGDTNFPRRGRGGGGEIQKSPDPYLTCRAQLYTSAKDLVAFCQLLCGGGPRR
jgi:hypothetical protein